MLPRGWHFLSDAFIVANFSVPMLPDSGQFSGVVRILWGVATEPSPFFLPCIRLVCKLRALLCKYSCPESCETSLLSSAALVLCVTKLPNLVL